MATLVPYSVRCLPPRPPLTGVDGGVGVGVAMGEGEGVGEREDPGTGDGDGEGVKTGECVGVVVDEYGVTVTSGVDVVESVDVDEFLCLLECNGSNVGVGMGEGVGVVELVDVGE